jgi:hypothetical protein
MPDETVSFPQDRATGVQDTVDFNDAASFAWLAHSPNDTEYIVDGFEINVDWNVNIVNVTGGVCKFYQSVGHTNDHSAADGPEEQQLHHLTFVGQAGASGDMVLNDDATNYIYIHLRHDDNDTLEYYVNTTATTPPDPYLLVGTVDMVAEEIVEANRAPTARFQATHFTE